MGQCEERNSRLGLVLRLVRDNQVLKEITSGLGSFDQLGGQKGISNLSALAHDSQPVGQLGVVLGVGQREVVAVIACLLHALLVDNGPNKVVVGALGILRAQLGRTREVRDHIGFLAVKGIQSSLDPIADLRAALEEEVQNGLEEGSQGVEALGQGDLDLEEGNVGTAGGISGELKQAPLLDQVVALRNVGILQSLDELLAFLVRDVLGNARVANNCELGGQRGSVGADPLLGLAPVQAGTDDVEDDEDGDDTKNNSLRLEVRPGISLMKPVPFGIRARRLEGNSARGGRQGLDSDRRGFGSLREVGEVCMPSVLIAQNIKFVAQMVTNERRLMATKVDIEGLEATLMAMSIAGDSWRQGRPGSGPLSRARGKREDRQNQKQENSPSPATRGSGLTDGLPPPKRLLSTLAIVFAKVAELRHGLLRAVWAAASTTSTSARPRSSTDEIPLHSWPELPCIMRHQTFVPEQLSAACHVISCPDNQC